jgi:UDP-N-acetylmuramate--alanine ligase
MSNKVHRHYHFIGIGGIGMGALASLLLKQGHRVSGSDIRENQIVIQLKQQGARIFIGHDTRNIEGADVIVFSSAITSHNSELTAAKKQKLSILPRAKLLAELMKDHIGITVAGAHGKTTTTSMISNLLIHAGFHPTTAVGGIVIGTPSHARLGEGEYFVAEVDESDGSFLYFSPKYSVITNIDFEHVDYYQNWDNILKAYREFIGRTQSEGVVLAYGEDVRLSTLLKESHCSFITYGLSPENELIAENLQSDNFLSSFDCVFQGTNLGKIQLQIPGKHNVLNALACIGLGLRLSIDFETIRESFNDYYGVQRRFQLKGVIEDIWIVDDYAHHPSEIETTLETAQSIKKNRLITVFQPHRYTRLKLLSEEFADSLTNSDYLIITNIYAASENPIEGITAEKLTKLIQGKTDSTVIYLEKEKIVNHLLKIAESGDLVLTMGAGDITHITDDFVKALKSPRFPRPEHPVKIG